MNFGDARLPERFWDKVVPEPNSGCLLWLGATRGEGYPVVRSPFRDRLEGAYRVALEAAGIAVPDGFEPDHKCNIRLCVNVGHLDVVTHDVNMQRAVERGSFIRPPATVCKRGHTFTPDTTGYHSSGRRFCKICKAAGRKQPKETEQ